MKPHKQTQPDRISQKDAARIMFAHAKAMQKSFVRGRAVESGSHVAEATCTTETAEAAFEALIAGMVQDEAE